MSHQVNTDFYWSVYLVLFCSFTSPKSLVSEEILNVSLNVGHQDRQTKESELVFLFVDDTNKQ